MKKDENRKKDKGRRYHQAIWELVKKGSFTVFLEFLFLKLSLCVTGILEKGDPCDIIKMQLPL